MTQDTPTPSPSASASSGTRTLAASAASAATADPSVTHPHHRRRRRPIHAMTAVAVTVAAVIRSTAAFQVGSGAAAARRGMLASTTAAARQHPHRRSIWISPHQGTRSHGPCLQVSTEDQQSKSGGEELAKGSDDDDAAAAAAAATAADIDNKFNDTAAINNVGSPLNSNDIDTSETSAQILAIDPAAIDFVSVLSHKLSGGLLNGLPAAELETIGDDDDDETYNTGTTGAEPSAATTATSEVEAPPPEIPAFVKMFRGSANYIANHRGTTAVYHIPGDLLEWDGINDLIDDIALTWLLGMKLVIVIGCRHQIDARLDHKHIDPIRHSSIRVTDAETLRIVKEEAGFVRFEVERQLARSLRVVKSAHEDEFSGNVVSGNFYSAQPFGVIDGVDYMYTGFPRRIEVEKIRQVHQANDIVLLTTLGVSPSGEIFNVNSESLAATAAGSLGASKIVYFTVRGTAFRNKDTGKIIQNLRVTDARNLLQHYRVKIHAKGFATVDDTGIDETEEDRPSRDDMIQSPATVETLLKAGWAVSALDRGVKRAHILAPTNGALLQELYTRDGSGTLISRDLYEGIRPANVNDVAGVYDLINPLVKAGTLVPRPRDVMERDIRSYYVYTRDNLIVACGQLKRFEGGFAEIGCLVVSRDYRSQGRGDAILGYLERLCLQCGANKVFVLSTQTMEWFVERGFAEVGVNQLPPSRRAVYNYSRRSKIYMKHIDGDRDLDAQELWWNR